MSTSLALINGDLAISSGRNFETVSNGNKLVQDLTIWILERFGNDPAIPLNGPNLDDYIGQISTVSAINQIKNIIIQRLQQYQAMQISDMKRDVIRYQGKTTLDPSEVLRSINSVNVTSQGTTVIARISITTLEGSQIQMSLPINNF